MVWSLGKETALEAQIIRVIRGSWFDFVKCTLLQSSGCFDIISTQVIGGSRQWGSGQWDPGGDRSMLDTSDFLGWTDIIIGIWSIVDSCSSCKNLRWQLRQLITT